MHHQDFRSDLNFMPLSQEIISYTSVIWKEFIPSYYILIAAYQISPYPYIQVSILSYMYVCFSLRLRTCLPHFSMLACDAVHGVIRRPDQNKNYAFYFASPLRRHVLTTCLSIRFFYSPAHVGHGSHNGTYLLCATIDMRRKRNTSQNMIECLSQFFLYIFNIYNFIYKKIK